MNNKALLGLSQIVLSISAAQAAMAAEEKGEGFIEGSSLSILNRNFYFNRDFRKGQSSSTGNGYSEEWAHGVIGRFESGSARPRTITQARRRRKDPFPGH